MKAEIVRTDVSALWALVRSKMIITLEVKLCLSNFSRGIERQKGYQGTNIT